MLLQLNAKLKLPFTCPA